MKKLTSLFLLLCMSMATWSANVPSQAPDVMLQAFYWDSYPANSSNLAYGHTGWQTLLKDSVELGEYFDLVWLPPTANGDGTGYIPKQYSNLNSAFGSEADLKLLIGSLKRRNSRAIADIVINHCGNMSSSCNFYPLDFGVYGKFTPDNTWVTTDDEGNCGGGSHADEGYDNQANYNSARDWDHKNANVQAMCRAYLKWMKQQGYDGWRYDYCKGFTHDHINDYNTAAGAYISVLEYWDGNAGTLQARLSDANWNTMVFDFSLKYNALNNGICSFNYAKCAVVPTGGANSTEAGLLGVPQKSKYAVTFIDNHDTFGRDSDSEFGGKNKSMTDLLKDRLLQAHAYILSMPGIPCVFYPHWVTHKDAIKKMIEARHMMGVHSESTVKDEQAEQGGYQATIVGKKGWIILQLGNKTIHDKKNVDWLSAYTLTAYGNGYAIWTCVKETEYYMKNNWDKGDWAWKKMTAVGDGTFKLENVVFGGSGVNYNTSADDGGAVWVELAKFKGDAIAAGDKVTFTLDPTAGTVTAKKADAGGDDPEQPAAKFYITGDSALVVDAGLTKDKAWKADAIKSVKDTLELTLKADQAYKLKLTLDGTWNNGKVKGYDDLSEKADGLSKDDDGNICFKLSEADKVQVIYFIGKDSKVVFKLAGKFAVPEPSADEMTVYYVNTGDWSVVKAYVWKDKDHNYKDWPGEAMTKTDKQANGKDVYSYKFPKEHVNIIFNDGGDKKTDDLVWDKDKPYYYINKWYASLDDIPAPETPGKFYITGDSALVVDAGLDKDKAWKADAIKSVKDTLELTLKADQAYKLKLTLDGTWADGKVKGYDDLSEKADGLSKDDDGNICFKLSEADKVQVIYFIGKDSKVVFKLAGKFAVPEPSADEMTVYYVNTGDWSVVKAYVWKDKDHNYKDWPGEAMTKTDKQANGKDVYSYKFPKEHVNIIFNDGGDKKTDDLVWDKDKPYYYINKWYASLDDIPAPETPGKFYITGDSALVVDAGLDKDKAWKADAIKSVKDTLELTLKADQAYKLKLTLDGTWADGKVKGYDDLSEKADGLSKDNDGNICFKLSEAGKVQVIYFVGKDSKVVFKLAGKFAVPEPVVPAKFYVTGDSALVVDAGLTRDKAWEADAIKSEKDTLELTLKADQAYKLKLTLDGTWADGKVKGYDDLSEKADGLSKDNDGNICFKLSEAGKVQVIYFVGKDSKVVFKLAGKFATSGDQPGGGDDPEQPETMTVYFVNVPSWSAVNAFVWPAEGAAYKEWPGEAMKKEEDKINGYDVYSYTFAKTYVNIIFNDGNGTQTVDLTWSADKPYFYPTDKTDGKYSSAWYAKASIPTSGDDPVVPGETLDLQLVPGVWALTDGKIAAWAWKDGEEGAWTAFFAPKAEGNDTLTAKIPAKADKIIFVLFKSDTEEPDWTKEQSRVDAGDIDKQGLTFTITGATTGTWERVDDPIVPPTPSIVDGYYLVGTISEWTAAAKYLFTVNPDNADEYVLHTTLAAGDGIKVVKVANGMLTDWYPDGMGTEYTVDAEHAGKVTIYFRPAGNADWSAFGGFFYIAVDETTALDAIRSNGQAVKILRNGQLLIIRDGKIYTVHGVVR